MRAPIAGRSRNHSWNNESERSDDEEIRLEIRDILCLFIFEGVDLHNGKA